jgi:hypothetical protein
VLHKHLKTIVTWDYVNEPGISVAKKWHAPSLESHEDIQLIPAHLAALRNHQRTMGISLESSGGVSAEEAMKDLGWDTGTGDGIGVEEIKLPPSAKW